MPFDNLARAPFLTHLQHDRKGPLDKVEVLLANVRKVWMRRDTHQLCADIGRFKIGSDLELEHSTALTLIQDRTRRVSRSRFLVRYLTNNPNE